MRCMDGENEMLLTCREQADGVSILRCETRDPVVLLPDEVDGRTRYLARKIRALRPRPRPCGRKDVFLPRHLRRRSPRPSGGQHPCGNGSRVG